jgi:hypothetical protein
MGGWLSQNWFDVLSAVGIIGGLLFTAHSLRSETETRRISNLLTLTRNHRELWSGLFRYPELGRVLDASADLSAEAITVAEHLYVNMAIQHLGSAYQALKSGLVIKPEGLSQDMRSFFSLPIPRMIWGETKALQNDDFVAFVEKCLTEAGKAR